MEQSKSKSFRQGFLVFVGLALLTAIEYVVAVATGWVALLVILALVKAGMVLWYYMHIRLVFREDEGGHE